MRIAKKALSVFLSLLMVFTACAAGLPGLVLLADAAESKYTHEQVIELVNAATASGFDLSSEKDKWEYTTDDGTVIAAAEAIFDYAVKVYRAGKTPTSANNSSAALYAEFDKEFKSEYTNAVAADRLVKNVLDPNGTEVYGYDKKQSVDKTLSESTTNYGAAGTDVTETFPISDYSSYYPSSVKTGIVTKTVAVQINLEKYLLTFDSIDDIPSSFLSSVQYVYAHANGSNAVIKENTERSETGSGCNASTTYYYTPTITFSSWNYMSAKPVRTVVKDKTTKKQLLAIEKFFNVERLAESFDSMLALSLDEIQAYYKTAEGYYSMITGDPENNLPGFSKAVIDNFKLNYDGIAAFMENLDFAYRIAVGKYNIDVLLADIGKEYNKESYQEMADLHTRVSTAYGAVYTMSEDVINFIVANGYAEQYNKVTDLEETAEAYIAKLLDIMTERRLVELVASMTGKYDQYNGKLNKEDIENPSDAEITGLLQNVNSYNSVLSLYPSYTYYRTYYTTEFESKWNSFCAAVKEVAQVRGIKDTFKTYSDYFAPLLFTTQIATMDIDAVIDLHKNFQKNVDALKASYNDCKNKWGQTIADKIFSITYTFTDKNTGEEKTDWLLHELVVRLSKAELESRITTEAEAQIDVVYGYKDTETVDFDNFAEVKSVISHFDADLHKYASDNGWIKSTYQTKYAELQNLIDTYHAFTTTDGEKFFNKDFTFADKDGVFATRYAGSQWAEVDGEDDNGNPIKTTQQIGFPNDIARDGEKDNFVVTETELVQTVTKIDDFITSRDFGALVGFVDEETEEATDLATYLEQMLTESLYTDDLINSLVAAIFPMLVTEIEKALVNEIGEPIAPDSEAAKSGATSIMQITEEVDLGLTTATVNTPLYLYMDDDLYNGDHNQKYFYEVLKQAGLYIYPCTLAESLAISNPSFYGVGTEIYNDLMSAGDDWSKLIVEDDPDTPVDESKTINYKWGVEDRETFLDTISCVLDTLLPLLQVLFTGASYEETLNEAVYAKSGDIKLSIIPAGQLAAYADLDLSITTYKHNDENAKIKVYDDIVVPLFELLGVEKYPTLGTDCSSDEIVYAVFGTLLDRVDEILAAPISSVLEILPNLVYWLSMDSVQEIINDLNIRLDITVVPEVDEQESGGLAKYVGKYVVDMLDLKFPLPLAISSFVKLYDMLGFEITNFNEVIDGIVPMLGGLLGGDEGAAIPEINLPPIRQQEIIFCSEWTKTNGKVDLVANKGDLMYWFINYLVSALAPDENGNSLLTALIGTEMDENVKGILDSVVASFTSDPRGALAAIVELLNPVTYDLAEMEWVEQGDYDYKLIPGANNMSIVYLNYGNDWTQDDADYLAENIDTIVATVLEMTGSDIESLGAFLKEKVDGLFTNANITALVEMLGGLGDSPSAVMLDIVANQVGIDLESWFVAFGYLFPEGTWAEDAEIIKTTDRHYVNNFGVEGVANEDGTISWFFNRMPLVDGDGYTFVNILTRLLGGANVLVDFLFAGGNVSAFEGLVTLKGYETYASTLGTLLTVLGVENLPTQADFNSDSMGSLSNMLFAVLDWFYALTESETIVADLLEIIPDLFCYLESNGLSVFLKNLLMPVLVLADTVRPILDIDLNGVLSLAVSDFINYGELDTDAILGYLLEGKYENNDADYMYCSLDVNNLQLSQLVKLADAFFGTSLYESGLVQIGIKGLCSGLEAVETAAGTMYTTTVTPGDTITIIITALLDCLNQPAKDGKSTNGGVLFAKLGEMTESDTIANLYSILVEIIAGVECEYVSPNWGYMFDSADKFSLTLPEQSVVYLGYTTDWTEDTAAAVYSALDEILDLVLPLVLKDNETLATLINGVLEDKVYTDKNLNTIVELLVNLIAGLDETLRNTIDVVIDTNIAAWFTMCELNEETGKYECTKPWGVDAAAEADKKDIFVAGIKEVLAPANQLLAWLFFGDDYKFFTGSETNEDGDYIYNDIITLAGGEGYAYGLAPILEALGCTMQPASAFETADGYDVGAAVESILNSVLALVDTVAANPVEEAFKLIPNLVYFINADGLVASVNNLLAPLNTILEKVSGLTDGFSLNTIIEDAIGIDITSLSTEALLQLANDKGVNISDAMIEIISELYVGNLTEFTAANGNKAYRLDVTGYEGDVLTLVLSAALDIFNLNEKLFSDLLGAETYTAVAALLKGLTINFVDINWAYMYDGDLDKLNNDGFPEQTIDYLGYTTDWDEETAAAVYGALDDILALVLDSTLEEGENIATLVNGLLNDNVYSDAVLTSVVELIVNALAGLDEAIYEAAGAVLDADIAAWFDMCEPNAEGEYVCTKKWGVDAAAEADKKDVFVAGIKEVLNPANKLLSWLFFGEKYELLNGTTNEVLITINGGQGYAYGLVPIFEALGCTMQPASAFKTADGYDVGAAVESILDAALALVDDISADPIREVFELLPNVFYFINAEGLKASVTNLLAPVNAVVECLNPVIGDFSIGALLTDLAGFDVSNITVDTLLKVLNDNLGFTVNDEMAYVLKNLYVGEPTAFDSASGRDAYKVAYTEENAADVMLTILLSFALDAFNINEEIFSDLLGEEIYNAVKNLILGAANEFTYREMNWAYMYEGEDAADKLAENNLPERTGDAVEIYLQYQNNWNKETAEELDDILDKLVDAITKAARGSDSSLGQLLDNAISKGLYQDSILNSLIEMVVELLVDYEQFIAGAGALLGAEGLTAWFGYCDITTDANGETVVKCTKDWGIDAATTNDAKREAFIEGFVTALQPAYRLLAWLLFGEDYTFFNGTTNEALITITGGNGYDNAIVPLLEGVSAKMPGTTGTYVDGESAIKSADEYYVNGELNMEQAVRDVFSAVTDWLYTVICGDLANQDTDGTLSSMLDIFAHFIYFVNADGLKVVVNNLLVPVNSLIDALAPFGVELNIADLLKVSGADIADFDFYDLFVLLENLLGLYFPDYTQKFLAEFYIGQVVKYESANGKLAYYMTYSEEETRADMITCVLSFVVDAFQDPRNAKVLSGWMGADIYNAIINVLDINAAKAMQEFSWLYTEYADTDKVFTPIDSSVEYGQAYDEIWTEEMAQYIADNLVDFTTKIISLLGLEINGYEIKSVEDLINSYLNGDLYTQATADSILDLFKNITDMLGDYAEIGDMAFGILDKAIGTSLGEWKDMEVTVVDGNRESFVAALKEILAPIVPLLDVLLCGEDLSFFYSAADKSEQLTIPGSEGYAYGIVPLFEALGCTMLTPDEFKALDNEAKIGAILDALLDRVDAIMLDPVNEIFAMLPAVLYFINSNGLDTAVNNIVNTVDTVLAALEPVFGEADLMTLLGVDLAEIDFNYIAALVADMIAESTGMEVEALLVDAVAELTMGKVVTYQSANGETYYTMVYANDEQLKDMVTVVLRLAVTFLATAENADAIAALLVNNADNEEAATSARNFISLVLQGLGVKQATSGSMATIYYIFYGLKMGVDVVYDNYYDSWTAIFDLFKEDERPVIDKLLSLVGGILGDFAGFENGSDSLTCKCSCHSTNALVSFIQTVLNLIRRIFKMTDYQYCACGIDHWA